MKIKFLFSSRYGRLEINTFLLEVDFIVDFVGTWMSHNLSIVFHCSCELNFIIFQKYCPLFIFNIASVISHQIILQVKSMKHLLILERRVF